MNRRRLLIVVDCPKSAEILAALFRCRGWDVAAATSVAAALDRLYPPPDCLLAGVGLPDGSCYEFIRRARERSPAVRVVLQEGWDGFYDAEVCRRVDEEGLGLPADGSAGDEQYDAFFKACDRTRRRLLDEEVRPDVFLEGNCFSPEEYIRACEPT